MVRPRMTAPTIKAKIIWSLLNFFIKISNQELWNFGIKKKIFANLNPQFAIQNPQSSTIFVQFKSRMQYPHGQFGVFFFDNTGDSNFRGANHHDINVLFGQGCKHL